MIVGKLEIYVSASSNVDFIQLPSYATTTLNIGPSKQQQHPRK